MSRLYRGPVDREALVGFLTRQWVRRGVRNTFHSGDVYWRLRPQQGMRPERDLRLWYGDDGRVSGFAWFDPRDASGDTVGEPAEELLDWMEARARAMNAERVCVGCFDDDRARAALLTARGYSRPGTSLRHNVADLASAPPQPKLPEGFRIVDGTAGRNWIERRAEVHRRAWENSASRPRLTAEAYADVVASAGYRPELDVAVENDAGELVTCLNAWYDASVRFGLFEPVGCDPAYRRRGLMRAAMHHGLQRLRLLGARHALVRVQSENRAANALYASAGFDYVCSDFDWERGVRS